MEQNGEGIQDKTLRLQIYGDGTILANDAVVQLADVEGLLRDLKEADGVVWYYREHPEQAEPPEIAMDVIRLISDQQLPICLSPTPEFENCKKPSD